MLDTEKAIKYAIEDAKKRLCEHKSTNEQLYKLLLSDILDDNGNCVIEELFEKKGAKWSDLNCGGYILTDDEQDVLDFVNKYAIGLEHSVKNWSDVLNKEIIILW